MATLKLGRGEKRDYGTRYDGKVIDGNREVNVTYREPSTDSDTVYVNANGLSAGRATMRLGAIIGAKMGFKTVTLDYTNRSSRNCLDSNAQDIASVTEAFSDDHHKRLIGLSEGGLTTSRAMLLTRVQAATLVNPAGLIEDNDLSWTQGIYLVSTVAPECGRYLMKDPIGTLRLGASCVINCAQRPFAVIGEANELRKGNEHHTLNTVKQQPDAPHVRVCWSDADGLLEALLIEAGAKLLPIDESFAFRGGHCDYANDPVLARTIYDHDIGTFGAPGILKLSEEIAA